MKAQNLLVITPVWAQSITVEKQGQTLLVTGWGHIESPITPHDLGPQNISKIDIFRRFHRYHLRNLRSSSKTNDAGVYQFADANNDEKLIDFVNEFGPVWGEVKSAKYEENGTWTLSVAQSMKQLRIEQKNFAAAVRLLQQLNRNAKLDRDITMRAVQEVQLFGIDGSRILHWALENNSHYQEIDTDTEALRHFAHLALCGVLNKYPLPLIPFQERVIELPNVSFDGVRNVIYAQLRRDYLAQRAIGTCVKCGDHFPIYKRGARACSESCRRALRNRKYWARNRKGINRKRRSGRAGGR